ncbi:hypothetical protein K402DRAFT_452656 [Aulographum hederae CBS 113979]|uniref:Nuclear pore complex protein An-Nup82 n=1 Tax=Aulographum hederae CBS 113979 TaxID=1176131 RepID=A0A6G1H6S8_9PEZI|nr:hypothetical protein K402DRAFT_452656 [Aulographum hederae CBS 113979]
MPMIRGHTPGWLSRPSPGFELFSSSENNAPPTNGSRPPAQLPFAPQKNIAYRGTEVFVAVGSKIRWADLAPLKDGAPKQSFGASTDHRSYDSSNGSEDDTSNISGDNYKTLKIQLPGPITQLSMSPQGVYLAVSTSHTVHVLILPELNSLQDQKTLDTVKMRAPQLGHVIHVRENASLASLVWHPLGPSDSALVTVSKDSVVRLWELNGNDKSSFDQPTLAIDLKKLASATTQGNHQFAPSTKLGVFKGFSIDSVEMAVASACFGGKGVAGEYPWASMTLWVAMTCGDIYALCPLLPTKWSPALGQIDLLSTLMETKEVGSADDEMQSGKAADVLKGQQQFMKGIHGAEPAVSVHAGFGPVEIYGRPKHPGSIPKLQGPFQYSDDDDWDGDLTDLYVMDLQTRAHYEEGLQSEDGSDFDEEEQDEDPLSTSLVWVLSSGSQLHLYLSLEGVQAEWLPPSSRENISNHEIPGLALVETIQLSPDQDNAPVVLPTFVPDAFLGHTFFVNHGCGISYVSAKSFVRGLKAELADPEDAGAAFRLNVFLEDTKIHIEHPVPIAPDQRASDSSIGSGCIVLYDDYLGYMLLTTVTGYPTSLTFDSPSWTLDEGESGSLAESYQPQVRASYQQPAEFFQATELQKLTSDNKQGSYRIRGGREEIRLSPATLEVMTEAHRILSSETYRLGIAAADLFRRCKRLQDEFQVQIEHVEDVRERIDSITGEDEDDYGEEEALFGKSKIEKRIQVAYSRQDELHERHKTLREKLAKLGALDMSDKEKAFGKEIRGLEETVLGSGEEEDEAATKCLLQRLQEVKRIAADLVVQAKEVAEGDDVVQMGGAVKVPRNMREERVSLVMDKLERNTAMVDMTAERLESLRLQMS